MKDRRCGFQKTAMSSKEKRRKEKKYKKTDSG